MSDREGAAPSGHDGGRPPIPPGSAAWLEAALRERLGPDATIGELAFEGRLLRIRGARLPLGAAVLAVAEAEIELGAGLPLGALPIAARLVSLRGELTIAAIEIPIELAADDPEARAWFSGALRAKVGGVIASPIELDLPIEIDPEGVTIDDGRVTAGGLGAVLGGSIAPDEDSSAINVALTLATAGSGVQIRLGVDPDGTMHGAHLVGRLALIDLRALVAMPGGLAFGPDSQVDFDLDVHGTLGAPTAHGRVYAAPFAITRGARGGAFRFDSITAFIDLDRRRLRYRDLRANAHGARLAGWGRIPFAPGAESVPLLAVAIEQANVAFIAALASLGGVPVRAARGASSGFGFHVPPDLTASGELMLRPDRAASGTLAIGTPRSDLRLGLALAADGGLVGSTLRGRLAVEDAATIGLFPGPVRPRPPAVLQLDGRLGGSLAAPGISGRVQAERVILDVSADPAHPSLALDDVSVLLDVSRERLAWHRLAGRLCGGTFASSGRVDFGSAAGLSGTLAFQGVRLERLPTQAAGESRLAALIEGAAVGDVRFDRHGFGDAPFAARGEISIVEPRYLFARTLAEPLGRYGLPRIRSRGTGPLSARLRLEHRELFVDHLQASVDGVDVDGGVRLALDGRLGGRIVVNLLSSYLSQSPILAIPAALAGRVTIPVDLGGTVRAPEIHTDALAILEGLIAKNRVGDALKGVLDELFGAAGAGRKSKRG